MPKRHPFPTVSNASPQLSCLIRASVIFFVLSEVLDFIPSLVLNSTVHYWFFLAILLSKITERRPPRPFIDTNSLQYPWKFIPYNNYANVCPKCICVIGLHMCSEMWSNICSICKAPFNSSFSNLVLYSYLDQHEGVSYNGHSFSFVNIPFENTIHLWPFLSTIKLPGNRFCEYTKLLEISYYSPSNPYINFKRGNNFSMRVHFSAWVMLYDLTLIYILFHGQTQSTWLNASGREEISLEVARPVHSNY